MSLPHRLPLEVLERIFFFALDGDAPLATPTTCVPVTPPVSTSHLLLVSKSITALAEPLYWRSVTILKADDWAALWCEERGLFSGEKGEKRASWVREIRINVNRGAQIPIDIETFEMHMDNSHGGQDPVPPLVDLDWSPLPGVQHLCLFDRALDTESDASELTAEGLDAEDDVWDEAVSEIQDHAHQDENSDASDASDASDDFDEFSEEDWGQGHAEHKEILRRNRTQIVHQVLGLPESAAFLRTIRLPATQVALELLRNPQPESEPLDFGTVRLYNLNLDGRTGLMMDPPLMLDEEGSYEFAGVPLERRADALSCLRSVYEPTTMSEWHWIEDDGRKTPLMTEEQVKV